MKLILRELLERVSSPAYKVDREHHVIKHVKVLGPVSVNRNADGTRNVYPLEARRKAIPLYEGAKVNVDHPNRSTAGSERSYRDRIGRLRNVTVDSEGTYADLHLNPKHPVTEQLLWDAENAPDSVGMSHNAQGKGRVSGGDCLIEEITSVWSTDVVSDPATTRGLIESQESKMPANTDPASAPPPPTMSTADPATIVAAMAAILADESTDPAAKLAKIIALTAQADEEEDAEDAMMAESAKPAAGAGELSLVEALTKKFDALEARLLSGDRASAVERLLVEAKLPEGAVTPLFRKQLLKADDAEAKALIEERRTLAGSGRSTSRDPGPGRAPANNTTSPIKALGDLSRYGIRGAKEKS